MSIWRRVILALIALAQLTWAALLVLTTLGYQVRGVEADSWRIAEGVVEVLAEHDAVTLPEDEQVRFRLMHGAAEPARQVIGPITSEPYLAAVLLAALALPTLIVAIIPNFDMFKTDPSSFKPTPSLAHMNPETHESRGSDGVSSTPSL